MREAPQEEEDLTELTDRRGPGFEGQPGMKQGALLTAELSPEPTYGCPGPRGVLVVPSGPPLSHPSVSTPATYKGHRT